MGKFLGIGEGKGYGSRGEVINRSIRVPAIETIGRPNQCQCHA